MNDPLQAAHTGIRRLKAQAEALKAANQALNSTNAKLESGMVELAQRLMQSQVQDKKKRMNDKIASGSSYTTRPSMSSNTSTSTSHRSASSSTPTEVETQLDSRLKLLHLALGNNRNLSLDIRSLADSVSAIEAQMEWCELQVKKLREEGKLKDDKIWELEGENSKLKYRIRWLEKVLNGEEVN
jgi:phage shock protein A